MRVLFLPHGRRQKYFMDFLRAGRAHGWEIGVVCAAAAQKVFAEVASRPEEVFTLPDFGKRADAGDWQTNIGDLIVECERAAGLPANRLVLASERDIGRAFGLPFYHWPLRDLAHRAVSDNTYPRKVLAAQFSFMDETIKAFSPDLILGGNFASPHHCAAAMLAARMGIPALSGRSSKILSDRTFWSRDLFMLNEAATVRYEELAAAGKPPSDEARAIIDGFRNRPAAVGYIARYWSMSDASTWMVRHRFFAELLLARVAHIVRRRPGAARRVLPAVAEYYRTEYLAARQRRFYARPTESDLAARRYVYIPLHKEPELAINFQAPQFHNQYETVAQLSASLPYGVDLVVREHRLNRGRRPTRFYRNLVALPNVILADPFDNQFKYIRNASAIVTDNGSSGWEGIMFGRPVIALAKTFYDPTGLAIQVQSMADLPRALLDVLGNGRAAASVSDMERDRRIGWLIDAERETTAVEDSGGHMESIRMIEAQIGGWKKTLRAVAQ